VTEAAIGARRGNIAAWHAEADILALQTAHATLMAGCRFLIARGAAEIEVPSSALVRLRVAGNHLKELDRFLTILISQSRAFLDTGRNRGHRLPWDKQKSQQTNPGWRLLGPYWPRLRAIKRLRTVACEGPVDALGCMIARDLAIASAGRAAPLDGQLVIGDKALADIAQFYSTMADVLLCAMTNHWPSLDFPARVAHIDLANVACDGI
jgi:hypothetical protein